MSTTGLTSRGVLAVPVALGVPRPVSPASMCLPITRGPRLQCRQCRVPRLRRIFTSRRLLGLLHHFRMFLIHRSPRRRHSSFRWPATRLQRRRREPCPCWMRPLRSLRPWRLALRWSRQGARPNTKHRQGRCRPSRQNRKRRRPNSCAPRKPLNNGRSLFRQLAPAMHRYTTYIAGGHYRLVFRLLHVQPACQIFAACLVS